MIAGAPANEELFEYMDTVKATRRRLGGCDTFDGRFSGLDELVIALESA